MCNEYSHKGTACAGVEKLKRQAITYSTLACAQQMPWDASK
jgi:hypothetical protein